MEIREQILSGNLALPNYDQFITLFGFDASNVSRMFKAAWQAYLLNKGSINLTYWAEQFQTVLHFNNALKVLSDNNWLETHSIPARNWAEALIPEDKLLSYVTPDELSHVRASKKFARYMPENLVSEVFNLTKQNGRTRNTGLVRYGLKASASSVFMYDTDYLAKYQDTIILNTNKGMQKVRDFYPEMHSDEASYDTVSTAIVEALTSNPSTYSMGNNYSDSRGRAIKEGLSKVANPIGYKDFRALLVIPEDKRDLATDAGATAIYLFIAELHGFKNGSAIDKELFGVECYLKCKLHDLDLTVEADRAELHENIWLERLYDELDAYTTNEVHYWSTPIELDASALTNVTNIGAL